ncbi:MAG: hypothetical protein RLZZ157_811, partial [Pseudomonadota bacterium]
ITQRAQVLASSVANSGQGNINIDPILLRDVAALRVGNARSAGGVFLLDAFAKRPRAGLLAKRADDQPLLSDAHYLEEALAPYADINRGDATQLVAAGLDAILVPDAGALPDADVQALTRFAEQGGLLIRFAGPKLVAAGPSPTLPAPLSEVPRSLKGALTWGNGASIGAFERSSPFAGLTIPADARVNQLAAFDLPATDAPTPPQIWARMADNAPLVSAAPRGRGWVILFHTTAGPAWSEVAFSGLQVAMLRRVLARANSSTLPTQARPASVSLKPVLVLDGMGNLRPPQADHLAIAPQDAQTAKPDARHPPGIYEGGGSRLILQAAAPDLNLPPLPTLAGVTRLASIENQDRAFGPLLLALGLLALMGDLVLTMALSGRGFGFGRVKARLARLRTFSSPATAGEVGPKGSEGASLSANTPSASLRSAAPPLAGEHKRKVRWPWSTTSAALMAVALGIAVFDPTIGFAAPNVAATEKVPMLLACPEARDDWERAARAAHVRHQRCAARAARSIVAPLATTPPTCAGPNASKAPATGDVALAYLVTGDTQVDNRARRGLEGLARVLSARTSVEAGAVVGIDPARDDLALYPLIYWLLPDQPNALPQQATRALDRYMKSGGILFVDTRGAGRDPAAARALTRTALRGIEAPPLEPVPQDHVLGKTFYLLAGFPGRFANARIFVETKSSALASANDGVSPLLIGDGDWASAWALAAPSVGYQPRTRDQQSAELAARVGVNVVLYALTGSYKDDQVHFDALLQRLPQRRSRDGQTGR